MSKDKALAFLRQAAEDPELQKKIVDFAAGEGYEFTVEELTDAELDAAAGGVVAPLAFPKVESTSTMFPKVELTAVKISTLDR